MNKKWSECDATETIFWNFEAKNEFIKTKKQQEEQLEENHLFSQS